MGREHRIITALEATQVPVPHALALCTDQDVNDGPFYVMSFVEGHVLRNVHEAETAFDPATRSRAGLAMADTLATLHAVDVDGSGLGDLGKRGDYIGRQLRRWHTQFQQSTAGNEQLPMIVEEVHEALAARIPSQDSVAVVHGDFRIDNVVFDEDGSVEAVLDWEICTLGDPLADLGQLMVYWTDPGETPILREATATTARGFPTRQEVKDRYAEVSGRDVSQLGYYEAFGNWKLACILQGVYARYVNGAAAGDRSSSPEAFAGAVLQLSHRALRMLKTSI
jgi:aminoglycoside phosphotransferase (APT) family kinase protein